MKGMILKGVKFLTIAVIVSYTFVMMFYVYVFVERSQSTWAIVVGGLFVVICLVMLCVSMWSTINLAYANGRLDMIKQVLGEETVEH